MPKYGVHKIVLEHATALLDGVTIKGIEKDIGGILRDNNSASILGAIGPDMFFWAPDYDLSVKFRFLYTNIDKIKGIIDAILEPIDAIKEEIVEGARTVLPATTGMIEAVFKSGENTVNTLLHTIGVTLFDNVIAGYNFHTNLAGLPSASAQFFREFAPQRQKGNEEENDWYWFDMLHYRNTGDFAHNLVRLAKNEKARAYAYGYLSHVATDLTGHPFVNQIVGGPFRLHVQRHMMVENFIDAWKYIRHYPGENINETLFERLDLSKTLPSQIRDLLHQTFNETYKNVAHPAKFLTPDQIEETYENFYMATKLMGDSYLLPPQEPFSGAAEILAAAIADLLETPPAPTTSTPVQTCSWEDILGQTAHTEDCYNNFFRQMDSYIAYVGEILEYLFETLLDLIDLILAGLSFLPANAVLAYLYGVQLMLYEIYKLMRHSLVMQGFLYPDPYELDTSYAVFLTTTMLSCTPQPRELTYPHQMDLNYSHLICPGLATPPLAPRYEEPTTAPSFLDPNSPDVIPDSFIHHIPLNIAELAQYASLPSPVDTRIYYQSPQGGVNVGNSIELTEWMINTAVNGPDASKEIAFANFDLDGDRGYFYKTWNGIINPDRVDDLEYV